MTHNINWIFSGFKTAVSENGMDKVVKEYTITAEVQSNILVSTNLDGTQGGPVCATKQQHVVLGSPDAASFVAFQDLTKDNLINWAMSALNTTREGFTHDLVSALVDREEQEVNGPSVAYSNDIPPLV